jgi:hypothetical protein
MEADTREAGRRKPQVGNVASGAGAIEPRAAGTQEGFSRRRMPGEVAGGPGINSELCARCRAASVEDGDAPKVSLDARSRRLNDVIGNQVVPDPLPFWGEWSATTRLP